jgi:uncharacterized protein YgiM (DUF1202 family)
MTMTRKWVSAAILALALLIAGAAATAPKSGARITVRVLSAKVMKDAKFIGATVASVSRGDFLTFQEAHKDWYKVTTASGSAGWIHKTNVTDSEVKLSSKPGGGTGGASQDEVELAGRGFTPEVEQQYRSKHRDLDFSHVDAIEDLSVDGDTLAEFAREGKVGGR